MIILNEVKYAEKLIQERKISSKRDINVLTKYLYLIKGMDTDQIIEEIKSYDTDNEFFYYPIDEVVHNTVAVRLNRPLEILNKDLIFTKGEIDYIKSFKSLNFKKILFVLFTFSKLYNNSFFFKKSEIIRFAKLPDNCQSYVDRIISKMIKDNILDIGVYNKNYVQKYEKEIRYHISDGVRELTMKDNKEEIIIKSDLLNNDFILYFLDYIGEAKVGYCQNCGCIFEQSRNGRIKLCKTCREEAARI